MDNTIIDIIKSYIKSMEDIESKFLSKEFDEIIDEGLYIKTLEKHNMLLGILNKYYYEKYYDNRRYTISDIYPEGRPLY